MGAVIKVVIMVLILAALGIWLPSCERKELYESSESEAEALLKLAQIKYKKGAMIWDHAANRYRQSMGIVLARYTDDEVHIFVWTDHMAKLLEVYSSVTKQWLPNTKPANR